MILPDGKSQLHNALIGLWNREPTSIMGLNSREGSRASLKFPASVSSSHSPWVNYRLRAVPRSTISGKRRVSDAARGPFGCREVALSPSHRRNRGPPSNRLGHRGWQQRWTYWVLKGGDTALDRLVCSHLNVSCAVPFWVTGSRSCFLIYWCPTKCALVLWYSFMFQCKTHGHKYEIIQLFYSWARILLEKNSYYGGILQAVI